MDKHEHNLVALTSIELEQVAGGAQEDYFTFQRQQGSLTYQRPGDGASQNVGFEYGGLNAGHVK